MADMGHGNGFKILVVDDDPSMSTLLATILENQGYQPLVCNQSKDALKISKKTIFSLAFIDINLPDASGLELASQLKQDDPTRELVFITGSGSLDNAVQAIKLGAYDYLKKPILLDEFKLCLRRFQEKQALREQIRRVEQRHFHLVQHIPLLIYVLNKSLELVFINEACSGMLGFSPSEAIHTSNWFLNRIHEDERGRAKKMFQAAFVSGIPVSIECRFFHKDGHYIHTILKSMPPGIHGPGTKNEQLEGFALDITDRVFLERSLVHREKLKTLGVISAEVAHEIRNPLMSIGGFAKRLKQRFPDLHECDIILNESKRLEKILSRIRNYLEPVEIHPKECSVNKLLEDCLDLLSPETEKRQVAYELFLDMELPFVYADPEVLTQIFINLVRNAVNAIDEGGILMIKGYESDQNIRIDFQNKVMGGKTNHPETIFMPFAEGGQSFGLPLCYRLVKDMGGLLSFAQDKNYVTFTVSLPKRTAYSTTYESTKTDHDATHGEGKPAPSH